MKAVVVGSGSWGTSLAILLARNGHDVTLCGRDPEEIGMLRSRRENLRYLPGFVLPKDVVFDFIVNTPEGADFTVLAVPSGAIREVSKTAIRSSGPVVIAAKGLELGSAKILTQVASEVAPHCEVGALSGPNLAVEVVRGIPTVAVSAFPTESTAMFIREAFSSGSFRVAHTTDVVGVELAGALKNVLAIGAGMSDGLGFGDNTKGAFLSRGLIDMARLGMKMGALMETFLGAAGVGDLFATAASRLSRNYRVGLALGQGIDLGSAVHSIGQVAEGVPTSEAAQVLAREHELDLPVFAAVENVIRGHWTPTYAVQMLMERPR